MLLETHQVVRSFGGVRAVDEVSLSVEAGELRALIGPNGAGKSTLFSLVSGHLEPDSGAIAFDGRRIERLRPAARSRLGIAITFQTVHLFGGMTVLDNVRVGGHSWTRHEFFEAAFRMPRHRREEPGDGVARHRRRPGGARIGFGAKTSPQCRKHSLTPSSHRTGSRHISPAPFCSRCHPSAAHRPRSTIRGTFQRPAGRDAQKMAPMAHLAGSLAPGGGTRRRLPGRVRGYLSSEHGDNGVADDMKDST